MPPCGRDILQSPAEPCPVLRRRRCLHRPAEPCGGLPSPLRRPFALHCRAGVHARRGSLRRVEHFGFAQTLPRKALRYRKPQAAGKIARPTKSPQAGGGTHTSADRQARRRADASIGPYAGAACRPPSTARVSRIVGRAFTPAGEVCGGWNISVLHRRCPAKPCDTANPKRRAKLPALQSPRKRAAAHKRQPTARPAGGPEGYLQGQAPHPSAACGGTSPYRGGFNGQLPLKKAPLQGELDAP